MIIVIIWIICAVIGYNMGKNRTCGEMGGLLLGLILGIIGLIIIAFIPRQDYEENMYLDTEIAQSYSKINEDKLKALTVADELKKWHDLFKSGAITEEEYQEKKNGLIK